VNDTDKIDDKLERLTQENERLVASIERMTSRLEELERLADTDTLVPLPNRRAFLRETERAIQQVARYGSPIALLFVDLDGLKRVNDTHGHQAGDALLLHVASHLQASLRAADRVARISGDEFAILLDHLDEAAAQAKADMLSAQVSSSPLTIGGLILSTSITIGLAMIAPDDTVQSLLARADAAMYAVRAQRSER
jgi:diguanylate cyclase (GGDEF)-like protein